MKPLTEPTTPAFIDQCYNCYKSIEGEHAEFNLHTSLNILPKPICMDCIDDVIQYGLFRKVSEMASELYDKHLKDLLNRVSNIPAPCRKVSAMTKELRDKNDWELHRLMGDKLVPHRYVNHI